VIQHLPGSYRTSNLTNSSTVDCDDDTNPNYIIKSESTTSTFNVIFYEYLLAQNIYIYKLLQ
jgi:hypothetical protein